MARFDDRSALVTGAGGGIGRAIALALAAEGARVAFADLDAARADEAAAAAGGGSYALEADVADPAACRALVAEVERRAGRLDLLVCNAGLQHVAPLQEFPEERWDRMLAVMLSAPFHLAKAAFPGMVERRYGRILNVASVLGLQGQPFKAAYVSAKHGLLGLTKVIGLEGAPHGVTCNALCPSYVRTPLVEAQVAGQARAHGIAESEVLERVFLAEPAIKRLLEPEEVARAALFLLSEDAAFMTGAELRFDGGYTAR